MAFFDPGRAFRPYLLRLFGLCVALLLMLVALAALVLWFERDQILRQAERSAESLTRVLAEHTTQSIRAIDESLAGIIDTMAQDPVFAAGDDSDANYRLLRYRRRVAPAGVLAYYLLDENGRLLNSSRTPARELIDLSDRDVFVGQRDGDGRTLFIGATVRGRIGFAQDRWVFNVSRRIERPDGSFAGIVAAAVSVEALQQFYATLDVGRDGAISLLRRDGVMLARTPDNEAILGRSFADASLFRYLEAGAASGTSTERYQSDGVVRISSYRTLTGYPLVVALGISRDEQLAGWTRNAVIGGVAAVAIVLAILAALWAMQRGLRKAARDEETFLAAETERKAELERNAQENAGLIARLREIQTQLLEAQDIAGLGIWRLDLASGQVEASPTLQRIAGRPVPGPETSDAAMDAVVHEPDRAALSGAVAAVVATGELRRVEYRIRRPDGALRDLWAELRAERGDAGRIIAVRGICQDVTERKATEEHLRQTQKMDSLGQLTGGIAHDFNNLLMVIVGNLELLCDDGVATPEVRRMAQAAMSAAERGATLNRQLLAYARRQPLDPERLDVNQIARKTTELLRRTLGERIEVELVLGAGLWRALADPAQVENAIINLALNARDAMPEGGKLTIETANSAFDHDAAAFNDVAPGHYVMIAVSDTGCGMTAEVAARAFEPFFTTKPLGQGTGLGLSMVYGFAKQSGGHAKIYSEPGHGTTVKLYLPRARADAREQAAAMIEPATHEAPAVILVVEDDPEVRETVALMLRGLGYEALLASDATEALRILESDAPVDLLFTDVMLPGETNGRALAERAARLRPGLPVLYSSGYTKNSIIHHGRLDDDVELLSKPYKRQDLAARLRTLLASSKA